jgi:hypothetical protein
MLAAISGRSRDTSRRMIGPTAGRAALDARTMNVARR